MAERGGIARSHSPHHRGKSVRDGPPPKTFTSGFIRMPMSIVLSVPIELVSSMTIHHPLGLGPLGSDRGVVQPQKVWHCHCPRHLRLDLGELEVVVPISESTKRSLCETEVSSLTSEAEDFPWILVHTFTGVKEGSFGDRRGLIRLA